LTGGAGLTTADEGSGFTDGGVAPALVVGVELAGVDKVSGFACGCAGGVVAALVVLGAAAIGGSSCFTVASDGFGFAAEVGLAGVAARSGIGGAGALLVALGIPAVGGGSCFAVGGGMAAFATGVGLSKVAKLSG
jgi:hypothetical protein